MAKNDLSFIINAFEGLSEEEFNQLYESLNIQVTGTLRAIEWQRKTIVAKRYCRELQDLLARAKEDGIEFIECLSYYRGTRLPASECDEIANKIYARVVGYEHEGTCGCVELSEY